MLSYYLLLHTVPFHYLGKCRSNWNRLNGNVFIEDFINWMFMWKDSHHLFAAGNTNRFKINWAQKNVGQTYCQLLRVVVLWVRLLWINRKSTKHKTLTKGLQQQTFLKGIKILLPGKLTLSSMKACSPNLMQYLCLITERTPTR